MNVGGYAHHTGLTLEFVTSINLLLTCGLALDYAAHIGVAFVCSKSTTRNGESHTYMIKVCILRYPSYSHRKSLRRSGRYGRSSLPRGREHLHGIHPTLTQRRLWILHLLPSEFQNYQNSPISTTSQSFRCLASSSASASCTPCSSSR